MHDGVHTALQPLWCTHARALCPDHCACTCARVQETERPLPPDWHLVGSLGTDFKQPPPALQDGRLRTLLDDAQGEAADQPSASALSTRCVRD